MFPREASGIKRRRNKSMKGLYISHGWKSTLNLFQNFLLHI